MHVFLAIVLGICAVVLLGLSLYWIIRDEIRRYARNRQRRRAGLSIDEARRRTP